MVAMSSSQETVHEVGDPVQPAWPAYGDEGLEDKALCKPG